MMAGRKHYIQYSTVQLLQRKLELTEHYGGVSYQCWIMK